jgi:hypothetical protein
VSAATALRTPETTVHEAHAALHVAMDSPRLAEFAGEIITLAAALGAVEGLDPEALGWGWTWPRLSEEDDRELLRRAENAESAAGALIAAMSAPAARSGTEDELKCAVAGVKS